MKKASAKPKLGMASGIIRIHSLVLKWLLKTQLLREGCAMNLLKGYHAGAWSWRSSRNVKWTKEFCFSQSCLGLQGMVNRLESCLGVLRVWSIWTVQVLIISKRVGVAKLNFICLGHTFLCQIRKLNFTLLGFGFPTVEK